MTPSYAELRVSFSNPCLTILHDETEQLTASCQLTFDLDNKTVARGKPFSFLAPIGAEETAEIRWYLESYYIWPVEQFQQRAQEAERSFSLWGEQLLAALLVNKPETNAFNQWLNSAANYERTFSLHVQPGDTPNSALAASKLLGLPWELLHQNNQYLFANTLPISIKRHISGSFASPPNFPGHLYGQQATRILMISPRPLQTDYIDHRSSAKPLIETLVKLDKQTELVRVNPPTFKQLETELDKARTEGKPFHILHFDGHGEFDLDSGRGMLCFEHPLELKGEFQRPKQNIDTKRLEQLLTANPVPLVFLEACQTAQSEVDPSTSVATAMLQAGALSVVAMSHNVLVETTRRFVNVFYRQLVAGKRVSTAITNGRKALIQDPNRINVAGAGILQMQDWFVPVLYQHETETNPNLFIGGLPNTTKEITSLLLGDLTKTLTHTEQFIGRSRDLLRAERLLDKQKYIVIRGMGGIGKTALAIELAHWLVQCRQFKRCAFVSVETYTHDRAILDTLGKQLVDERYTVAEYGDNLEQALQPIIQVFQREHCLLVLDNLESLLADVGNIESVLALFKRLLPVESTSGTRLLFTTREPLPAPFADKRNEIELREMELTDAKALVMQVMHKAGLKLQSNDPGNSLEEVDSLVSIVGCHARALVLLARELAKNGAKATTQNIQSIMERLDKEHPGDRENSLFASVELSLQRLPAEIQQKVERLVVFQGGGNRLTIIPVTNSSEEEMFLLEDYLTEVGLIYVIEDYGHLIFDPAFSSYLRKNTIKKDISEIKGRWLLEFGRLIDFIYEQAFKNTHISFNIFKLEIKNITAFMNEVQQTRDHNKSLARLRRIEQIASRLNMQVIVQASISIRKSINMKVTEWGSTTFGNEKQNIERLIDSGEVNTAVMASRKLLSKAKSEGEKSYIGAASDLTMAYVILGRTLRKQGNISEAINSLEISKNRLTSLRENEKQMVSVCLTELGDCYKAIGKNTKALSSYEESIALSSTRQDERSIAVTNFKVATILKNLGQYDKALAKYQESLKLFEKTGEASARSSIFHQLGQIYRKLNNYSDSEKNYLKSLKLDNQLSNFSGEAMSLSELGGLYEAMGSHSKATLLYQKSVDIHAATNNKHYEYASLNNLANNLLKLNKLEEAQSKLNWLFNPEIPEDQIIQPWKAWDTLSQIEHLRGNSKLASSFRDLAVKKYHAFRKSGGENHFRYKKLADTVLEFYIDGKQGDAISEITKVIDQISDPREKYSLQKLISIAQGEVDISIAQDQHISYDIEVELTILLEEIAKNQRPHT